MLVSRERLLGRLTTALGRNPVTLLTGPRQCGKTTLARQLVPPESVNDVDLEDPVSLARLEQPMTALGPLRGLVVIDEVERRPDLFPVLRVLADRHGVDARFLILGSAAGDRLRQSSESLAWRRSFVATLLERDLPRWAVRVSATALRRFWTMLARYHAQPWNASEHARALGVDASTARRYLDVLSDALVARQLPPWHADLRKRQVRTPKVYVRDSGLLHALLGLGTAKAVLEHPKVGASREGFVLEQVLATTAHDEAYFWATHQGAEIDLLLVTGDRRVGVEVKRADAPKVTPSMRTALEDLALERVLVVNPGARRCPLVDRIEAVPFRDLSVPDALVPPSPT